MGNFTTYANGMKTNGIPFNKKAYEDSLQSVLNAIHQRLSRENTNIIDVPLFLSNPYEITIEIANQWGQDALKIFYVIDDRDVTKIGKMDVTNRNRVDIFYSTVQEQEGYSLKLELIYLCLLIHVLNYEKEQILTNLKGSTIKQTPIISTKFFGFKKNPYVYLDYVGRFINVPEGRKAYTIAIPNINQLGLLNGAWGMSIEDAREYLSGRKQGLLHEHVTLDIEERNLPFLLSEAGELFQNSFNGVLKDSYQDLVNRNISNDGVVTKKFVYAFNSNPYTFTLSEFKIKTITNIVEELERLFPDMEVPFITDNRVVFTTASTTTLPEHNLTKYIKPLDSIKIYS